jgi:thymidylate synthase
MNVITAESMDSLCLEAIGFIKRHGYAVKTRQGSAQQVHDLALILTDSRRRLLTLRAPGSIKYLAREFLAYFRGSLRVRDGLEQASRRWREIADPHGYVNSNYGYYVFHERPRGQSQFQWVLDCLSRNLQSRRALININQPWHKDPDGADFPCAVAAHFFVADGLVHCRLYTRSADVVWGLPYDIAFFAFVTELLVQSLMPIAPQIRLGSTALVATFSQIYARTASLADQTLIASPEPEDTMPLVDDAAAVLQDIYSDSSNSSTLRWLHKMADQRTASGAQS